MSLSLIDGKTAQLVSDLDPVSSPRWYELEIDHAGRRTRPLPSSLRLRPPLRSHADGRYLVLTAMRGIRAGLIQFDVRDQTWRWMTPDDDASYGFEPETITAADKMPVIRTALDGTVTPWTDRADHSQTSAGEGSGRPIKVGLRRWSTADGNLEGLLAVPQEATDQVTPLSLIVELHGGPQPGLRAGELDHAVEWCQAGYAHFQPEFRSSGILGRDALWRQYQRRGLPDNDPEIGDVITGTKDLLADGRIDRTRLILLGFSYGATSPTGSPAARIPLPPSSVGKASLICARWTEPACKCRPAGSVAHPRSSCSVGQPHPPLRAPIESPRRCCSSTAAAAHHKPTAGNGSPPCIMRMLARP
jgi:hypothetical protein